MSRLNQIAFVYPISNMKTTTQSQLSPRLLKEGAHIDRPTKQFSRNQGEFTTYMDTSIVQGIHAKNT